MRHTVEKHHFQEGAEGRDQYHEWSPRTIATYHPAAVLRAPEGESQEGMREELFSSLRLAAEVIGK